MVVVVLTSLYTVSSTVMLYYRSKRATHAFASGILWMNSETFILDHSILKPNALLGLLLRKQVRN